MRHCLTTSGISAASKRLFSLVPNCFSPSRKSVGELVFYCWTNAIAEREANFAAKWETFPVFLAPPLATGGSAAKPAIWAELTNVSQFFFQTAIANHPGFRSAAITMARRIVRIDPAMSRSPQQITHLLMNALFTACGQVMFCVEVGIDRKGKAESL